MLRLIAFVLGLVALSAPAFAQQQPCFSAAQMMEILGQQYGESPVGTAVTDPIPQYGMPPARITLFVNPESGSWTIIAGNGTCYSAILSGMEWSGISPEPREPEVPETTT